MRRPVHNTTKLPRHLLEEIGLSDDRPRSRARRPNPSTRKDLRKTSRAEKKSKTSGATLNISRKNSEPQKDEDFIKDQGKAPRNRSRILEKPKSILKRRSGRPNLAPNDEDEDEESLFSSSFANQNNRETRTQLSHDDAEIAALEKALGVNEDGILPKPFIEDGLDFLLNGLNDSPVKNDLPTAKRKQPADEEWLRRKRKKARHPSPSNDHVWEKTGSETSTEGNLIDSDFSEEDDLGPGNDKSGSPGCSNECSRSPEPHALKIRENPYRPPVAISNDQTAPKYIPPSLRAENPSSAENSTRLRRQLQGLLNRLSDANLLSILRDIESIYRRNPRQQVSMTLLDLLIGLLCDPTSLEDTFIILHAGFISALYKVIGTDFGAQAIQKIHNAFFAHYNSERKGESNDRRSANLVSLLAQLYTFQVIGSNIVYDFIRLFLEDVTEISAELVLKIMRNSGPQLRQDSASSLKDIIMMLQSAIAKTGEENLSVRTKFMIETMNNLKNNRMKTGIMASTITSDHIIQMKKTLGTLNMQKLRGSEPLRIGLKDLWDSEQRGKWWLTGASYKDKSQDDGSRDDQSQRILSSPPTVEGATLFDTSTDLARLAQEQRMNTNVRRSIFIAIMSATDYKDAHHRLSKLGLKKSQELEVPRVLIHCAGAEESYNPFYALVSRRVCSDRKVKMAFKFSLWNLFKRMGENNKEYDEEPDKDEEDELQLRSLVNLAKFFGFLVAEDGIEIGVLKVLNFAYLQPKTRTFLELLLISIILQSQLRETRNEQRLVDIFMKANDGPHLASGLRLFLKKVISKTDVAGSRQDADTVKWGCKLAGDVLKVITAS